MPLDIIQIFDDNLSNSEKNRRCQKSDKKKKNLLYFF